MNRPNLYTEDANIEKRLRAMDQPDTMPRAFWLLLAVVVIGCVYWAFFS